MESFLQFTQTLDVAGKNFIRFILGEAAVVGRIKIGKPKPIRIIVTGTPGGPPDLLTRWLAERLAPALGGVIVVENRPGAGGNVAMQATARSADRPGSDSTAAVKTFVARSS